MKNLRKLHIKDGKAHKNLIFYLQNVHKSRKGNDGNIVGKY